MDISIQYDEIESCTSRYKQASQQMEQDLQELLQILTSHTESFQGPYAEPFAAFSQLLSRSHDQLTADLQSGATALQNISDSLHEGDAAAASILAQ